MKVMSFAVSPAFVQEPEESPSRWLTTHADMQALYHSMVPLSHRTPRAGSVLAQVDIFSIKDASPVHVVYVNGQFLRRFSPSALLDGVASTGVFDQIRALVEQAVNKPVFEDEVRFSFFRLGKTRLDPTVLTPEWRSLAALVDQGRGEVVFDGLLRADVKNWETWLSCLDSPPSMVC